MEANETTKLKKNLRNKLSQKSTYRGLGQNEKLHEARKIDKK